MAKILIIEDNLPLANLLTEELQHQNHLVDFSPTAEKGEYLACTNNYDLILLDLVLPDGDGMKICQHLHKNKITAAIIMLTAKSTLPERIAGLNIGADDYLPKPFSLSELQSRIHAVLRRHHKHQSPTFTLQDLSLNPSSQTFTIQSKPIHIVGKKFAIMELFMSHPEEPISRSQFIESVWGDPIDAPSTNSLDVHIHSLRKIIAGHAIIETISTFGFVLKAVPPSI